MEQQNRTQKDTTKWSGRKKRAIAAVAVAALALVVLPVFAWLYMQRSMETTTKQNNNTKNTSICSASIPPYLLF